MIKGHDRVVLNTALASEGLEPGDVGTVVHVDEDGKAYEVEFVTLDGHTAAVATVEVDTYIKRPEPAQRATARINAAASSFNF